MSDLDKQIVWAEAASLVGADPEDHENDALIQPVFDKLCAELNK